MSSLTRRSFLAASAASAATAAHRPWRVAIIGHTGHGNYGHGLDVAFRGVPNSEIVALADPDESGRAKAIVRSGARKGYAGFREMLLAEKPDIVVLGPRWVVERVQMADAIGEAGAHVLMEKPFAGTLEDADRILQAIGNRKVQVCHTARPAPATLAALRAIRDGEIGEILELRARGKEDRRAGGEDMMTLGTHCFDLMRMIAGNPLRCAARIQGGKKQPTEPVGPVAGDSIAATFEFANGVPGYFASKKNTGPQSRRYGVTVFGSKGAIDFPLNDIPNETWISRSPEWRGTWARISTEGYPSVQSHAEVNTLLARDLVAAIEENRDPVCSASDGRWAVEMVQGVYAASAAGTWVDLPLKIRQHPLL